MSVAALLRTTDIENHGLHDASLDSSCNVVLGNGTEPERLSLCCAVLT